MSVRTLAKALALNRILFGAGLVAAPERSGGSWIGGLARRPGARLFARAIGARDLALGIGALAALQSGRPAGAWYAGHLLSDATDLVATWQERRDLPPAAAAYALTMAGLSTGIAAAYLASALDDADRA